MTNFEFRYVRNKFTFVVFSPVVVTSNETFHDRPPDPVELLKSSGKSEHVEIKLGALMATIGFRLIAGALSVTLTAVDLGQSAHDAIVHFALTLPLNSVKDSEGVRIEPVPKRMLT